jgi:hypothetical protein
MDFLHCALVAILVLLAIYCFRSFREGFYVSVVNPVYENYCHQAKVTGLKENQKALWNQFAQTHEAEQYQFENASCYNRGYKFTGGYGHGVYPKSFLILGSPDSMLLREIKYGFPNVTIDASTETYRKE